MVPRKRAAARRHYHGDPGDDEADLDVMLVEPEMMDGMELGMVDENYDDTLAEAPSKKLRPDLTVSIRGRGQDPPYRQSLRKNKTCRKIQMKLGDFMGFFDDKSQGNKKEVYDPNYFSNL